MIVFARLLELGSGILASIVKVIIQLKYLILKVIIIKFYKLKIIKKVDFKN